MIIRVKTLNSEKREWSSYKSPRYKRTKHTITAYLNQAGVLVTGLTSEQEERLGKILKRDLSIYSDFWNDYGIVMTERDLILDTDNPEDEVRYALLSHHFAVKKSKTDKNPYAKYEIYNESEEARTVVSLAEVKVKAFKLYSELSIDAKRDILRLYPGFTKTSNVSDEVIQSQLYNMLESNPAKFVQLVEDKNREMRVMLKDLVTAGILTKTKAAYKYGTDFLGHNEEATIAFLNDPANQSLKITLIEELNSIKK